MAKLWGQITGALPDDTGRTDAGLDDADETAGLNAKIAGARQLGSV